ncbi:retrovirus-related pol polyprotein from transposon TNT 1-94 [Tanacetum coccineum]
MFENGLYIELKDMKAIFNQMETKVAKCSIHKKYFEIEKKELNLDNDRLFEHIICQDVVNVVLHADVHNVLSANNTCLDNDNLALELLKMENDHLMELLISQDLVHTAVNSIASINDYESMEQIFLDEYEENLKLQTELDKKNHMIEKAVYNELLKRCLRLENRCNSLEIKLQQSKESYQTNRPSYIFKEFFIINELQAQLKAKNVSIEKLKEHIANIKGKNIVDNVQNVHNSNVVTSKVYKLDLPPISRCIKNNMAAHVNYLKYTQENADILHEIVEHVRELRPLDSDLASACTFVTRIQELLVYLSATCLSSKHISDKLVAITPINKTRKVRFAKSSDTSKDKTQKQVHPQEKQTTNNSMSPSTGVSSSTEASGSKPRSNIKKERIIQNSICNENVKHFVLNANSEFICATCHECMFDVIHDMCVRDYLNDVNACVKSKFVKSRSAKSKKKKMWKPTGKVYTNGKARRSLHKPKVGDTNQEKLYLLHMDLCGPMHVESINGKKYILVIVDDYSRFTWFKFLRSKDETREVIIKCLKQIQFRLNATVKNVRTDNRTEFVNQTLKDYYENIEITHQTSVVHTSQLNDISSSRLVPRLMTPRILSSGLVPNPLSSTPYVPPTNNDWDILFQPMFDEFFNPPQSVVSSVSTVVARRPANPTGSSVSTYIKQYAPSTSNSSNQEQEQSPVISKSVEEHIQSAQFDNTSSQDTPSEESYLNV